MRIETLDDQQHDVSELTQDNTEGYTDEQLATINERIGIVLAGFRLSEIDDDLVQHVTERQIARFDSELVA